MSLSHHQGGVYILQIFDYYVAGWSLLLIGLTEITAVAFVYGRYHATNNKQLQ